LAKKTKPTEEDLTESKKSLQYWVFDLVDTKDKTVPFHARLARLTEMKLKAPLFLVSNVLVHDEETLDTLYSSYLDEGFEGQMVRNIESPYENKRSKSLLKRKTFVDAEFKLVDIESGRGGSANLAARAILETKERIQFEAGIIGSHEYAADLLKNKDKYIGKKATVVYQNMTPEGKPRFGKMKVIRDYE